MKVAYFDCFSGASGDMLLGTLVDAGVCFAALQKGLEALGLEEFSLSAKRVTRQGIACTKVDVGIAHGHAGGPHGHDHSRHLGHILALIEASGLSPRVKADCSSVFRRLADAEAKVHGTTPEKIHFHEVGAVDAIVDIVGAAICIELLGVDQVLVSPIHTGVGWVTCQHGRLPVPVPATVELLRDFPSVGTDVPHELTTPTGAAILTTLGKPVPRRPAMSRYAVGYGAGGRDHPERPNVLRVFVGELQTPVCQDEMWVVETNLDDLSPEIAAYACERLFQAGAVDVFTVPIGMKKGRQGVLIQAIAAEETLAAVEAAILRETSTLGVRRHRVQRSKLDREQHTVTTTYGEVSVKVGRLAGEVLTVAPEYESCKAVAQAAGVALRQVYQAAVAAFRPTA